MPNHYCVIPHETLPGSMLEMLLLQMLLLPARYVTPSSLLLFRRPKTRLLSRKKLPLISKKILLPYPRRCRPLRSLALQDCNKMTDADLLAFRKKRDRETYTTLARQPLTCGACTETLSRTGPLWWICSICSAKCRSHGHPGWGRKLEV